MACCLTHPLVDLIIASFTGQRHTLSKYQQEKKQEEPSNKKHLGNLCA